MPNAAHMHNKKQLLQPKPDNLKQEVMRGVKLRVQNEKMKNLLHEQVPSLTVSTCLLVFVCLFVCFTELRYLQPMHHKE